VKICTWLSRPMSYLSHSTFASNYTSYTECQDLNPQGFGGLWRGNRCSLLKCFTMVSTCLGDNSMTKGSQVLYHLFIHSFIYSFINKHRAHLVLSPMLGTMCPWTKQKTTTTPYSHRVHILGCRKEGETGSRQ
jgi:hypothetical protein